MAPSSKWFTAEDAKMSFNLFCTIYGIGTLGMPANFSRAGPVLAVLALLFMAVTNTYASVVLSKLLLRAPRSVKTYGDLGEWVMGPFGRWIVLLSQLAVALLGACAVLVLGSILLDGLFPGAFGTTTWIIIMALSAVPVCLTPTMKEAAGAALAGCIGTLVADIIAVALLVHGMSGHPSIPTPQISFEQVALTFGNLSLAYGGGLVIPALQRQHSDPSRMPRVVFVTFAVISVLFLVLASTGYSAVGCQISGNMLFTIYSNTSQRLTGLGFSSDWGAVVLAFFFMQVHISIAFSIGLHPPFYIFERQLLGMHKPKVDDVEAQAYVTVETPGLDLRKSKTSIIDGHIEFEDEAADYVGHAHKYIPLRLACLVVFASLASVFKDHFSDLTDFTGASGVTLSCILLPLVFYLKKLWKELPHWEKAFGVLLILICFFFGAYTTYKTGKVLFKPSSVETNTPPFPFCHEAFQYKVFYNATEAGLGL